MFELWPDPPFRAFRLFKYVAGPPAVALFIVLVPLLWAVPRRRFRAAAIAASLVLLAFSSGITFMAIFVVAALAIWRLSDRVRRAPALAVLAGFELVSAAAFHLPWRLLPVYRDPRLPSVYPGLLTDRELFFYLGLAFTGLRALHLSLRRAGERPPFPRILLYLAWGPTFRIGPFVPFDEFDRDADRAGGMPPRREVLAGLAEAVFGGIVFEGVIAGIDRAFFRRLGPDDGSYWYYWFFDRPPQSALLTLVGVVLVALRYYLLLKAYCHVARGASRMAGIPLPRSMRWPLLSTDLASFWRRYNVTVSRFTEDHVLKPVAAETRPAVAVAAAFLFMGLWHRPAWHTVAWGAAQVAGIALWWEWRGVKRRSAALRRSLGRIPPGARAAVAIGLTLAFVAATVPLLLDLHHGGTRVYRRLLGNEGTGGDS
ncbi:MAG TPA: MBOAT family O-acyltransferase, partial [Thermoanaerobaculia bacterium]|nr:MBOAT family O-acyltransferase [Thermoanaerobaculia bacterium]